MTAFNVYKRFFLCYVFNVQNSFLTFIYICVLFYFPTCLYKKAAGVRVCKSNMLSFGLWGAILGKYWNSTHRNPKDGLQRKSRLNFWLAWLCESLYRFCVGPHHPWRSWRLNSDVKFAKWEKDRFASIPEYTDSVDWLQSAYKLVLYLVRANK